MATPAPPVPTDALWLGAWLEALLARAVAVLGSDAPARQYVSPGEPAADCDQLTVHLIRLRAAAGSSNPLTRSSFLAEAGLNVVPVADFQITLYRCVRSVRSQVLPTDDELQADAIGLARVGQALWYGLTAESVDGSLWPLQNKPVVLWRSCEQVAPQGGMASWRITGEVSLT